MGLAIQRAEEKTAQMTARAGALDELLASGALDDATGVSKDSLTLELEHMAKTNEVDTQLAALRAELAGPATTPVTAAPEQPAVEAGPAGASGQPSQN